MVSRSASTAAGFVARSVCEPGQVAGEECGLRQVSGGDGRAVKPVAPSSLRWRIQPRYQSAYYGRTRSGKIRIRPTVPIHYARKVSQGAWPIQQYSLRDPEANIIKKKDKLLGRFIPYFTCKIWNKDIQYVVLKKHDILGIFISYFTRKIWNKTTQ